MGDSEEGDGSGRRPRRRRRTDPQPNPDGLAKLDEVQSNFGELVNALATLNARRRDAAGVDNTDVESAFRELLHPRPRPLIVEILIEIFGVMGGVTVGYGLSISVPDGEGSLTRWIVILAGVALISGSVALKVAKFR